MTTSMANWAGQIGELTRRIGRRIQYMEVCGTHTVSLFRSGVRSMLPPMLRMVSGPGCPVCVTAQRHIDAAIELATKDGVVIATYGDMLRVPGRRGSLERLRAQGAAVRVVTSAKGALQLARAHPDREVVFLAVGFETTAPATASVIRDADRERVENFSALMCHKLVVPAMLALADSDGCALDGFLCPGHVSVIIGAEAYRPVVERCGLPCVIAGFEAEPMLKGIVHLLDQSLRGEAKLENVYPAAVSPHGNSTALALMHDVFVVEDAPWRELGVIPRSGLGLTDRYRRFDAARRFELEIGEDEDHPACRCGEVIQGRCEPQECALFDCGCTPMTPIGPCMVSSEGTCAAWYRYNRRASKSVRGVGPTEVSTCSP